MTVKTQKFDVADYLKTPQDIAVYLQTSLEEGDDDFFKLALGTVARSRGMTALARETGLSRMALYKALSEEGDPKFSTLAKVLKALNLKIRVEVV